MGSVLASTYWLPIYFQAVRNATPTISWVDILPQLIACVVTSGLCGLLVSRVGYYLPFAIASGIFSSVGSGLLALLNPTTPSRNWIIYQIIKGIGLGIGFQIPFIEINKNVKRKDTSIGTALIVFSQNLRGIIFLSLAQVVFSDRLRQGLAVQGPIHVKTVIFAGAAGFRQAVPAHSLPGVVLAYSRAFGYVLYLAAGAAAGAFLFSFGMGWVKIKKMGTKKNGKRIGSIV